MRILVFSAVFSFATVLIGAFFVSGAQAQVIDIQTLLKQIAELQAQIKALQAQVQIAQTQQEVVPPWCHDFDELLRLGDEGDEVEALQMALRKENVYKGLIADGVFDVPTFRALVKFQEKYRSEVLRPFGLTRGTGFMGRETMKKLNNFYGCKGVAPPVTIKPPIGESSVPIIDGVEGPTYLKVGEEGTWILKAHDPEQGTVFYAVEWGDEIFLKTQEFFGQKATFTHRYLSPGIYTVRFTVIDAQELTAKTSISINVVSITAQPSITVLSPNGGDIFQQGKNNTISWKGGKNKVQIGLVKSNFDPAKDGILGWIFTSALPDKTGTWDANSVSDLSLTTVWNVLALHPGPFKIIAVSEDAHGNYCFGSSYSSSECNYDYSDNHFSIVFIVIVIVIVITVTCSCYCCKECKNDCRFAGSNRT